MVIRRGDVWWADFGTPRGSKAAFRRPVIVVQDDFLNKSALNTIIVVPLSSNLKRSTLSTNVVLSAAMTGLAKDSVAVCTQIEAVNRDDLIERVGALSPSGLDSLEYGLLATLGLLG